ncbi:Peptidoglycan/xylan/chitin deacetylase, PgdA/CDA1 family [Mesonia phycicola]|uniref:Peptidoglycan/xylan/chitin deacetylase, PgdA/CDA1 family n=1 Tax=Mesonia phycicola TaxID=579105 RepID=A0A1M6ETH4_9FLAO|nr:polysaccharide deacetylase family protein [Mesonia phycicola]SHI88686.1 Peptidoglycan/xylan/chitin deacetylase, PgdA/CDA1 family [Mesonia phycicola]
MKWFNSLVPILKLAYPNRLWAGPSPHKKIIYLTFDDGPIPEITPWVLQILKSYNAKATFFCIGNNIELYPSILSQVLNAKHVIGNHTYNHINGWKTSTTDYLQDINFFENLGYPTQYFRPPYGKCTSSQAKKIIQKGYKIVMWDVISEDYNKTISPENCYETVISQAKSGSIIVFHDSLKAQKNLRYVLPKVLKYYTQKGYIFKSLPVNAAELN